MDGVKALMEQMHAEISATRNMVLKDDVPGQVQRIKLVVRDPASNERLRNRKDLTGPRHVLY